MHEKRVFLILMSLLLIIVIGAIPALAAKPQGVILRSNGFPSGMHFNLNIHGKDPATFTCPDVPGGNSIFVPMFDTSTIQYVSNAKKTNNFPDGASPYELYALDPCAVTDGTAKVYLPTKVAITDESGNITYQDAGGYYVFGRILGKPDNGGDGEPSSMILEQNVVYQACNDADPDAMDCDLALGLIVGNNLYTAAPETYERFAPSDGGQGKSVATDITPLFLYSGWVYWGASPETDGVPGLTDADIPLDWATTYPGADLNGDTVLELCEWVLYHPDINGDGFVDQTDATLAQDYEPCAGITIGDGLDPITLAEWQAFQSTLNHANYFEKEWIFNIADLVVTSQGITNIGATLVQIRFYPMNFTSFTPDPAY